MIKRDTGLFRDGECLIYLIGGGREGKVESGLTRAMLDSLESRQRQGLLTSVVYQKGTRCERQQIIALGTNQSRQSSIKLTTSAKCRGVRTLQVCNVIER
jgi:hypothetical protein